MPYLGGGVEGPGGDGGESDRSPGGGVREGRRGRRGWVREPAKALRPIPKAGAGSRGSKAEGSGVGTVVTSPSPASFVPSSSVPSVASSASSGASVSSMSSLSSINSMASTDSGGSINVDSVESDLFGDDGGGSLVLPSLLSASLQSAGPTFPTPHPPPHPSSSSAPTPSPSPPSSASTTTTPSTSTSSALPPLTSPELTFVNFTKCQQIYALITSTLTLPSSPPFHPQLDVQRLLVEGQQQAMSEKQLMERSLQIQPRKGGGSGPLAVGGAGAVVGGEVKGRGGGGNAGEHAGGGGGGGRRGLFLRSSSPFGLVDGVGGEGGVRLKGGGGGVLGAASPGRSPLRSMGLRVSASSSASIRSCTRTARIGISPPIQHQHHSTDVTLTLTCSERA